MACGGVMGVVKRPYGRVVVVVVLWRLVVTPLVISQMSGCGRV